MKPIEITEEFRKKIADILGVVSSSVKDTSIKYPKPKKLPGCVFVEGLELDVFTINRLAQELNLTSIFAYDDSDVPGDQRPAIALTFEK